jgi:predicted metal-dependent phosphoesterase TrpH
MEYVQRRTDLRVIAITDHNTIEGSLLAKSLEADYDFEVIVGEEVSSKSGHIIGLYLQESIPAGLSVVETLARISEQDGIAVIPHPFSNRGIFGPFGANAFTTTMKDLAFHALEVYNSIPYLGYANRVASRMFTGGQGIAATGGSDAHVLRGIGTGYTVFKGVTASDLRGSIDRFETHAESGQAGLSLVLRYAFKIPHIRRQRAWHRDLCNGTVESH